MNKTVNINLGGMLYNIDEDAYAKLSRYIDAIRRSLSNSDSKEEVMKDIELRISEILTEKLKNNRQVVGIQDIEDLIGIMGQPEDYSTENDSTEYKSSSTTKLKKLYRDVDSSMLGGVAAGLGHYFGVDKVWIRAFFLILLFVFGTGVMLYIFLWVITPKAVTTLEKLEMTGEAVTISNIERKVREEFEFVSDKIKGMDYDKYGNNLKNGGDKFLGVLGEILTNLFIIVGKAIGIVLFTISALAILALFVTTAFFTSDIVLYWSQHSYVFGSMLGLPIWFLSLLAFCTFAIPFFFIGLLGLRILSPTMKPVSNMVKYILFAVCLISFMALVVITIKQGLALSH